MLLHEPTPLEVRAKIEQIEDVDVKIFCKALYLLCATASELAGIPCIKEKAYGPYGDDFSPSQYYPQGISRSKSELIYNHELTPREAFSPKDIAVFTVKMMRIARRNTESGHFVPQRLIALPIDRNIEPWTDEVVGLLQKSASKSRVQF
jgi:hypothetical protein